MIPRRLGFLSVVSLLLCLATAGVGIWSENPVGMPWTTSQLVPDGYPLGHGIRILAYKDEISLYNQSVPYCGSVIGVTSAGSRSPWPREIAFDFPGVYFRHFTWPGVFPGGTYWTLTVSIVWPLILTLLAPLTWAGLRLRRARRRYSGRCAGCGYDLRASNQRCPECGRPIETADIRSA